jgi:hypothetical protein
VSGESHELHVVPADVRDPQAAGAQRRHIPGDQAQPGGALELVGALEQQLHAEADAQQRLAVVGDLAQQPDEPQLGQVADRQGERADAR